MNKLLSLAVIASFAVAANVSAIETRAQRAARLQGKEEAMPMLGRTGKANDIVEQGAQRNPIKEANFFDTAKQHIAAHKVPYIVGGLSVAAVTAAVVIYKKMKSKKPATLVVAAPAQS